MLNRIAVVPAGDRNDLIEASRDAWGVFGRSIPAHPLVNLAVEHEPAWPENIDSIALAVPTLNASRDDVEEGRIVLGERFWSPKLSADGRALTLLHESIHLRLMADVMPARTARIDAIRRHQIQRQKQIDQNEAPDVADFKNARSIAAMNFLLFPDEMWAECGLRDQYPDWLERRVSALLRMRARTRALSAQELRRVPARLHHIWAIYELLRIELVIRLAGDRDRENLAQLEDLKKAWQTDLRRLCPAERAETALTAIIEALPAVLNAETVEEGRYDQLFVDTLTINPG